MKKTFLFAMFTLAFLIVTGSKSFAVSHLEILMHWAPQVHQDMNSASSWGRQFYNSRDAIVGVNFDGDWNTGNNWANSVFQSWNQWYPLNASAYGSFVETQKFYFLGYGFYHAGDDSNISLDRHENDYEMVLICVKKDGSTYGSFRAMITQFHSDVKEYVASDLRFNGSHAKIYISANGVFDPFSPSKHGHGIERFNNSGYQSDIGDDAVVYQVAEYGDNVTNVDIPGDDVWWRAIRYKYKVIPITELWNRRNNPLTYDDYGLFNGGIDDIDDGGNPPWFRSYFRNPINDFKNRDKFNFLDSDLNNDDYILNPFFGDNSSQNNIYNPNGITPMASGYSASGIGGGDGKVYQAGGAFLIDASGSDIWNNQDQFYFMYHNQKLDGDAEIKVKVYSVQDMHYWSKAGIMLRESLNSNSKNIYLAAIPSMNVTFQKRSSTGGTTSTTVPSYNPANNGPVYLKVIRNGNTFSGYFSTDDINYQLIANYNINMNAQLHVGLASMSHKGNDEYCAAWYDKFQIEENKSVKIVETDEPDIKITGLSNMFHITTSSCESDEWVEALVYSLSGRLINSISGHRGETLLLDLSNVTATGVHILKVKTNHKTITKKIILH